VSQASRMGQGERGVFLTAMTRRLIGARRKCERSHPKCSTISWGPCSTEVANLYIEHRKAALGAND